VRLLQVAVPLFSARKSLLMHPSRVTLEHAEAREREREREREGGGSVRGERGEGGKPEKKESARDWETGGRGKNGRKKKARARARARGGRGRGGGKSGIREAVLRGRGAAYRGLENALFRLHSHRLRWVCREREMPAR
jgi:hypothetical protein